MKLAMWTTNVSSLQQSLLIKFVGCVWTKYVQCYLLPMKMQEIALGTYLPHLKDKVTLRLAAFVQGQFSEQNCLPLPR